jgi:hypothetical protein
MGWKIIIKGIVRLVHQSLLIKIGLFWWGLVRDVGRIYIVRITSIEWILYDRRGIVRIFYVIIILRGFICNMEDIISR